MLQSQLHLFPDRVLQKPTQVVMLILHTKCTINSKFFIADKYPLQLGLTAGNINFTHCNAVKNVKH